jgi:ABC-type uncharacterized transport system auxiliary subunit
LNNRHWWTVALACGVLAGCGQEGVPVPTDRFHRLMIDSPATVYPAPKLSGVLEVERFSANGVLQGRSIVFVEHDSPNVMHQYQYQLWSDPPTRMLQDATVDYLRDSQLADQVVPTGLRITPTYTLVGDIRQLEHVVGNSASVIVELEFGLRQNRDDSLVWVKSYTATRAVKDDTVGAATRAMGEAVGEILTELSADLARR